jgi:hypothetical protein
LTGILGLSPNIPTEFDLVQRHLDRDAIGFFVASFARDYDIGPFGNDSAGKNADRTMAR